MTDFLHKEKLKANLVEMVPVVLERREKGCWERTTNKRVSYIMTLSQVLEDRTDPPPSPTLVVYIYIYIPGVLNLGVGWRVGPVLKHLWTLNFSKLFLI